MVKKKGGEFYFIPNFLKQFFPPPLPLIIILLPALIFLLHTYNTPQNTPCYCKLRESNNPIGLWLDSLAITYLATNARR